VSQSKLVRDKVPNLIAANGSATVVSVRQLDDTEYLQALIQKLREETEELAADPSVDELADIAEVLRALTWLISSPNDLLQARQAKARSRGEFANRVWMTWEDR
jgi:predicted house-cleaning noncanonical NTP pyrophosphatase (MazG superfamily)